MISGVSEGYARRRTDAKHFSEQENCIEVVMLWW